MHAQHKVIEGLRPRGQEPFFHSVELKIEQRGMHYQFKLWHVDAASMCILIKEESDLLKKLKVGDVLAMRYYSTGSPYPSPAIQTLVRNMTKESHGRFRGHYLVSLEILETFQ
jgi:hypothetical protein